MGILGRWVVGVSIRVFGSRGCDLSFGCGGSPFKLKSSMFLELLGTFSSGPYSFGADENCRHILAKSSAVLIN